ncbi:beta-galactosidase [Microbacterium sp. HD4P20]|uniref:beta-galactosidase n=1 Tax=Microbacterium sp. HD4P20 TaxID=2864874 RepID=UPI001C63CE27|nr:beta-galactosidase [Microbacterium sp. HD4P20]MCP2635955.1 beta-galactosidase [Microbacterium sp. HD4P20]
MGNDEDRRPGLEVTNRALLRDGRPWLPVSGELHYSRVPRERWVDRLRLMRAGGVSVVSTYVPWIHHEPVRGQARFDEGLDLAAFVDAVRSERLELVLRIGPWIHGEVRNGGFPDWVQRAPVRHRTDDPAYLDLVGTWFGRIAAALDGRCTPAQVLAIQLDNELYDQPGHLLTLKRLAREAGMSAPLWTATAWGGAQLPDPEVLPLWGGYGDGFWADPGAPWDPTFRAHYFFSDQWDDPGIGADVRADVGRGDAERPAALSPAFPPATCELGGGMATAYHRRPRPSALDIAAVAHAKLGSGSAWQGYYMYAGGTNPGPDLEESQATGYPNDMTRRSYDFHAPIGEAGRAAPSHAALRAQHAFIEAFGDRLGPLPASFPDERPGGVEDSETLRWSIRAHEGSGFLFIGWHQPHEPLPAYRGAQFRLDTGAGTVVLPPRPVDIAPGTLACWPIGLDIEGLRIDWATASALTILPGADGTATRTATTLVLLETRGVPVDVAHDGRVHRMTAGDQPLTLEAADGTRVDVLAVPAEDAARVWVVGAHEGSRRLLVSDDEATWDAAGRVEVRTSRERPDVREYVGGRWRPLACQHVEGTAVAASVPVQLVREASTPTGDYGSRDGRQSAPDDAVMDAHAAVYRLQVPAWTRDNAVVRVRWAGDVAQLRVDGATVTDRFWDGSDLTASLTDIRAVADARVELLLLPLRSDTGVHLPRDAAARLAGAREALCALDGVVIDQRSLWRERTSGG